MVLLCRGRDRCRWRDKSRVWHWRRRRRSETGRLGKSWRESGRARRAQHVGFAMMMCWHGILAFYTVRTRTSAIWAFELQRQTHLPEVVMGPGVLKICKTSTQNPIGPTQPPQSTPLVLPTSPSFPSSLAQAIRHAPASALNALSAL